MIELKKLSVLAITALLVTGISSVSTVAGTPKAAPTTTSLTSLITSLINSVGDDTFSTIDLTALVSTVTSPTLTPVHAASSAAQTRLAPSSSGTSTTHYGPYVSGSPDSGTCGNNWADDTYNRHFTVFQDNDGSLVVVEQFKDGSFVTMPGSSPGSCDPNDGFPPGTVNDGVTGSMHGYFTIPLPPGTTQTSMSPNCDALATTPCTTTTFINTHFFPPPIPSLAR